MHQFDFNALVSMVAEDFPLEAARVTFVNLSDLKSDQVDQFFKQWLLTTSDACQTNWNNKSDDMLFGAAGGFAVKDKETCKGFLAVPDRLSGFFSPNNFIAAFPHERAKYVIFLHEFAHLILDQGLNYDTPEKAMDSEARADCFAMAYGYKKGLFTLEDIRSYSYERLCEATWQNDTLHGTHLSLDRLYTILSQKELSEVSIKDIAQIVEASVYPFQEGDRVGVMHAFYFATSQRDYREILEMTADLSMQHSSTYVRKTALKFLSSYFNDARMRHARSYSMISDEERASNEYIREKVRRAGVDL